jgi:hypothetical protein
MRVAADAFVAVCFGVDILDGLVTACGGDRTAVVVRSMRGTSVLFELLRHLDRTKRNPSDNDSVLSRVLTVVLTIPFWIRRFVGWSRDA